MASMTRGELTEDRLRDYDVLIISPGKTIKTEELSVVLWFVLTKGGGLAILGGEPPTANQLTSPFGIIMDDGVLIDPTDTIPGKDNKNFVIDRFSSMSGARVVRNGVTSLGFYDGHGLKISGNAWSVATGDTDTYSDTLSFTSGSKPPVAAASLLGNGLVFVLSDADMLSNDNIASYDNMRFGENIIDWLALTITPTGGDLSSEEIDLLLAELKLEKVWLEQERDKLTAEKNALELLNDMTGAELFDARNELEELKKGKLGPFTRSTWGVIIFGICILGAAILISRRGSKASPEADSEKLLGELGYEFEEGGAEKGEEIKEEELDRELGEL